MDNFDSMDRNISKLNIYKDDDTGEVIGESTRKVSTKKEDRKKEFVKLYLDDLVKLLNVKKGASKVILGLIRFMTDENIIYINKSMKERIASDFDLKPKSIDAYLKELIKSDIMRRVKRGEYIVNPRYVSKKSWNHIMKIKGNFKMTVSYGYGADREIKIEKDN